MAGLQAWFNSGSLTFVRWLLRLTDSIGLNADEDLVWRKVSDIQNLPTFSPAVQAVRSVSTDPGGNSRAEVDLVHGGQGRLDVFINYIDRTVVVYYVSGPFTGTQRITVRAGVLEMTWDVRFVSIHRLGERWDEQRLRDGTKLVLQKLASARDVLGA